VVCEEDATRRVLKRRHSPPEGRARTARGLMTGRAKSCTVRGDTCASVRWLTVEQERECAQGDRKKGLFNALPPYEAEGEVYMRA
jgi:hypothetical protein